MNSYKGKLLFLLSLFFISFINCFPVRELNDVMQKNNISDQQITDNQAFFEYLLWRMENGRRGQ